MPFYREQKGELVPVKGEEVPQEAVLAIERADEETIVQHLTSDFGADNFIYSYPIKGGHVVGIGVDGAKEIARLLGNIEILPDIRIDKDSDPDYIYAMVRAKDLTRNVTWLGVGRACKYIVGENWQPTDRVDEYAFVKAVNKGARNAVLALPPQEAIAKIVQGFVEQKKLKKLPPAYGKPSQPTATAKVGTEDDKLKKLRQQVGIEAKKVFKSDEERKSWQKAQYGVDSMTEMTEEQLNEMREKILEKLKAIQEPAKPSAVDLGFSSEAEQKEMRKELFRAIDELGYKTDDDKRDYITQKGWERTTEVTKETLSSYIDEVRKELELVKEAESISEDI